MASYLMSVAKIKEGVNKGIMEDRSRATHGDTTLHSFFISNKGEIVPWQEQHRLDRGDEARFEDQEFHERTNPGHVMVHSHAAENWAHFEQITATREPFTTFSVGDIRVLQRMIAKRMGNTLALIHADGRMQILRVPFEAEYHLRALFDKQIVKELGLREDWRKELRKGEQWYDVVRRRVADFASKHGLILKENLRWKPEGKSLEPFIKKKPYYTDPLHPYVEELFEVTSEYGPATVSVGTSKPYYLLVPGRAWPGEPIQMKLFETKPRIKRKGTYTRILGPLQPQQMRLFGPTGLAGRIMSCESWIENGRPYCFIYAPSCHGQKACVPGPAGQLRVCAETKQVFSEHYGKEITRCKRYDPVCSSVQCLQKPAPYPRPPVMEISQSEIKSIAEWMADRYNEEHHPQASPFIKEIMERGGIRPYKKHLAQERVDEEYMRHVPLFMRRKTGLPPDEMAAEMGFESDSELYEAISRIYRPKTKETKVQRAARLRMRTWRDFEDEAREYIIAQRQAGFMGVAEYIMQAKHRG